MRKVIGILLAIVIILASCVPLNPLFFTEYVVNANTHYSIPRGTIPLTNVASFNFKTNDTWLWDDQEISGWSKVCGINWRDNHYISARVVYDGEYIGAYFWIWNQSPMDNPEWMPRLFKVKLNHEYYCQTGWRDGEIFVRISDGETIDTTVSFDCNKPDWAASFSQPYVGGRYTIDHKWNVPIRLN